MLFHFFGMGVVQSWNLYCRHNESNATLKLREFKMQIADCLMRKMQGGNQQKRMTIYLKHGKRIGGKKRHGPAAPLPAKPFV